ncbi:hypothetical protein PAHAL_1G175800 [Panicum hallii]|uniref:Uncharacterized protein n=1 Tax=Panicum hallii TaxID=206008 RepID=A0A2T8KVJ0_9POAL|nr:hypothetical protein PAHAL_1G175800 [Panicum hallii]
MPSPFSGHHTGSSSLSLARSFSLLFPLPVSPVQAPERSSSPTRGAARPAAWLGAGARASARLGRPGAGGRRLAASAGRAAGEQPQAARALGVGAVAARGLWRQQALGQACGSGSSGAGRARGPRAAQASGPEQRASGRAGTRELARSGGGFADAKRWRGWARAATRGLTVAQGGQDGSRTRGRSAQAGGPRRGVARRGGLCLWLAQRVHRTARAGGVQDACERSRCETRAEASSPE